MSFANKLNFINKNSIAFSHQAFLNISSSRKIRPKFHSKPDIIQHFSIHSISINVTSKHPHKIPIVFIAFALHNIKSNFFRSHCTNRTNDSYLVALWISIKYIHEICSIFRIIFFSFFFLCGILLLASGVTWPRHDDNITMAPPEPETENCTLALCLLYVRYVSVGYLSTFLCDTFNFFLTKCTRWQSARYKISK